ncbi:tetratricopeptide repeat protein [Salmonella enterica]|uniref:Tetratricopeptide repeat protein n=3 Tax=Salmonella enterica TaxID=28901 RepID=A0A379QGE1_SALER|nr:hypothetical protein [Salmonella enterica]ECC1658246.1 hypothetical protein [Salmonella enterica subsp. salamae]ASG90674.1 hypothetical protein LFZ47_24805 [Salmonella enterica subsp. salamae serovar 55:k:z39 str. 1315K]ECD9416444.1 hypothetical protein [Salmonella enterica subsp. salamae]ECF5933338.1 hypothetical protein [Salmonella enterica subsp. salamae]EDV5907080.1 hypothetical protein [Salmonella enterica subsp. salamae]
MIYTPPKKNISVVDHIDYDEQIEEQSERRKIMIMALILLLLCPLLYGGMYLMDTIIQKSRPVISPLFSSISECVEYGSNISECTQSWNNSLPSFYRLFKHSPSMLKDSHQKAIDETVCKKNLFIADVAVVGNLYQLYDSEKNGNRCFDMLSNARALLKVTPYRSIERIDNSFKEKISETWLNIGLKLYHSNQIIEAIQVWKFIEENFADSNNDFLQIKLAEAWFNIGMIYYEIGREEQSIFYWKKIGERYTDSPNPAIRAIVSKSAVNMGQVLMLLNANSTFRTISNQQ